MNKSLISPKAFNRPRPDLNGEALVLKICVTCTKGTKHIIRLTKVLEASRTARGRLEQSFAAEIRQHCDNLLICNPRMSPKSRCSMADQGGTQIESKMAV
jgi:hypothetical protein